MGASVPLLSQRPPVGRVSRPELEARYFAAYLAELSSEPGSAERLSLKRRTKRLHRLLKAVQQREEFTQALLRG